MKFPSISAGEFFELLRPTAYVLSAVLSVWVFASAQRRGFRWYAGLAWALGTFIFPFVILPVFLIFLVFLRVPANQRSTDDQGALSNSASTAVISYRFLWPAVYGSILLIAIGLYLYRDYNTVDAHLARAAQAKLISKSAKTIREYRAALALEDNPHTHKLLGIELAEAGLWSEAIGEFRLAEAGAEPDTSLPFRLGYASEQIGEFSKATDEYTRFLNSQVCRQPPSDERCEAARKRLGPKMTSSP